MAQIECPWKLHAHDVSPLLTNPASDWEHPALMVNTKYFFGSDSDVGHGETWHRVPWWILMRQGQFKYIRTLVRNEIEELYDLRTDPDELCNLALDARYHARLATFRDRTIQELQRTNAGLVENLPAVRVTTLATIQWMRRLKVVMLAAVVLIAVYAAYRALRFTNQRRATRRLNHSNSIT